MTKTTLPLRPALPPASAKRLFHFTALFHLPPILRAGITVGEVPLTWEDMTRPPKLNAPNLTGSGNPAVQAWSRGCACNKTGVRITVDVPQPDPNLVRYLDLCKQHGTPPRMLRALDRYGQAKFWWIYLGVIPPDWFTAVEVWKGGDYQPVAGEALLALDEEVDREREKFVFRTDEDGSLVAALKPGFAESWLLDGNLPSALVS